MAKTLRVGLIGYRFMGRAHSNAWRQAPRFFHLKANVELHTICGRNAAGVQAARAQLGWQNATTDWREIVESPLIDIVDIVTPTICTRKWPSPRRKTASMSCAKSRSR